ncbi:unnamed protein product [Urochloa decumbens]|uniref:F-box domain-containing protein n=1 Tax=Urochloa decumbens TaxID=240449 RepID=A0ABC9ESY3_9POAL
MASPARSILPRLEPTASLRQPATLTDDVLEEIFLRVASHADLARASTARVSFRRLIADHSFLRRFRSRHPPLLLGFLSAAGQGFLPEQRRQLRFGEFAVCDPLSRQYMLLPRIPEDLLASVQIKQGNIDEFGASLGPSGDWEDTSFRVLCAIHRGTRFGVCVFSSISGCWSFGASNIPPKQLMLGWVESQSRLAYGCCYWKVRNQNELLKLDINTMEFSTIDLPRDHNMRSIAIVEAGEGNLGMFSETADVRIKSVEYYTFMQNGNGRANGWDLKNTIPTDDYFGTFICSAGGYIFLACPNINARPQRFEYLYSSLEIKTYNIERVSILEFPANYPYFGFPPSMSPRRIQI